MSRHTLPRMRPHTAYICVVCFLILLHVSSYRCISVLTHTLSLFLSTSLTVYLASLYRYICVADARDLSREEVRREYDD